MMSDNIYCAVNELLKFNYDRIYYKSSTKKQINDYSIMFNKLFKVFLKHLNENDASQDIYILYLDHMSCDYVTNNTNERIVIDYISGMTDDFFLNSCDKYL